MIGKTERGSGPHPADPSGSAGTSSISITRLAAATKRPQLVAGMHFMNPVDAGCLGRKTKRGFFTYEP